MSVHWREIMRGTLRVSLLCIILLFGFSAHALDFDKEIAKQERTTVKLVQTAKKGKKKISYKDRRKKGHKVANYSVRLLKRSQLKN